MANGIIIVDKPADWTSQDVAAKLRGVQFGRPRKQVPEPFFYLKEQWEKREITSRQAAKELHIAQDTFLRWVREQKNGFFSGKR